MPNEITIEGVIGIDFTSKQINDFLNSANGGPVKINVSSPGGLVHSGVDIFNAIRNYAEKINNVQINVYSLAASIASYIILAGNKISIEPNSSVVIHNVWNLAVGDYREMQKNAIVLEKLTDMIAREYSKKTKKSIKEMRKMMDDETYLVGNEILNHGFADELLHSENVQPKDELVILSQGRIATCLETLKKSGRSQDDLQKAAALIGINSLNFQEQTNIIENKTEEKNSMNEIETLNAKINALQTENDTLKKDIKNISAHLVYADIAPNEVLANIKDKKEFDAVAQATYGKIQMTNNLKNARLGDNPENLSTDDKQSTSTTAKDDADTAAYIAQMKARRGNK